MIIWNMFSTDNNRQKCDWSMISCVRPGPGQMTQWTMPWGNVISRRVGDPFVYFGDHWLCTCKDFLYLVHFFGTFNSLLSAYVFSSTDRCSPSERELRVDLGLRLLLPCVQLSPRPCTWDYPPHRHTRQHHSDLEVTVHMENLGKYTCTCQVHKQNRQKPMWAR